MSLEIVSPLLISVAIVAVLFRLKNVSSQWKVAATLLVFFLCALPINNLPLAYYLRGMLGDLSITTQLLLGTYCYSVYAGKPIFTERKPDYLRFAVLILLTGAWFYPSTLGLTYFDPYNLGYSTAPFHWSLLTYFFGITLYFYRRDSVWLCGILSLSMLAFYFDFLESDNYWDYIMDPILVLGSIIYCSFTGITTAIKSVKRTG